jgi:hypothetical protein
MSEQLTQIESQLAFIERRKELALLTFIESNNEIARLQFERNRLLGGAATRHLYAIPDLPNMAQLSQNLNGAS